MLGLGRGVYSKLHFISRSRSHPLRQEVQQGPRSAGLHKVSTERPVFHGTEREVDVMRRDLDETRAHSERAALDLVQVSIRLP